MLSKLSKVRRFQWQRRDYGLDCLKSVQSLIRSWVKPRLVFPESVKHSCKIHQKVFVLSIFYNHIIYINFHLKVYHVMEERDHGPKVGCPSILESKGHDSIAEGTSRCSSSCLFPIFIINDWNCLTYSRTDPLMLFPPSIPFLALLLRPALAGDPQAPKSGGMLPAMEVYMLVENRFLDLEMDIETPSE